MTRLKKDFSAILTGKTCEVDMGKRLKANQIQKVHRKIDRKSEVKYEK